MFLCSLMQNDVVKFKEIEILLYYVQKSVFQLFKNIDKLRTKIKKGNTFQDLSFEYLQFIIMDSCMWHFVFRNIMHFEQITGQFWNHKFYSDSKEQNWHIDWKLLFFLCGILSDFIYSFSPLDINNGIVPLSFPATRAALWDHKAAGAPSHLHVSYYR